MGIFSRRDQHGFDKDGYDKDGRDRDGYDRHGGYSGHDKDGYDKYGVDKNGFTKEGFDKIGYDQFAITSTFSKIVFSFDSDFSAVVALGYNEPTKMKSKLFFSHDKKIGIYSKEFESFYNNNVLHFRIEIAEKQFNTKWIKPKDTGKDQGDNFESGYTLIVNFNKNDHILKKTLIDKLGEFGFGSLSSGHTLHCHKNEKYPTEDGAKKLLQKVTEIFLSEAIGIDPEYSNAWVAKGNSLYNLERYEEAIEYYNEAIRLNPEDSDTWVVKGNALAELGRHEEAIECYNEAIRIDPENSNAWDAKGRSLKKLGRYIEADDNEEDKDDDYGTWNNKGYSLARLERHEEAIGCFDKAIRLNPEDSGAWFNKGNSLTQLERHEEAIECYNEAIRLNPEDSDTWNNKGYSLKELGRDDEAEECIAKAKELDES